MARRRHRRQKLGASRTKTVNSSSRPSSMPIESSHLAVSGNGLKVPAGPIVGPSPGPTLEIAVAAPEAAVTKARQARPSATASSGQHPERAEARGEGREGGGTGGAG